MDERRLRPTWKSQISWAQSKIPYLEQRLQEAEALVDSAAKHRLIKQLNNQLAYAKKCLEQEQEAIPHQEALAARAKEERLKEKEQIKQELFEEHTEADYLARRGITLPKVRQAGLRQMIHTATQEGADILKLMVAVLYDDPTRLPLASPDSQALTVFPRGQQPTLEQRMAAADWLAARLWGRPVQIAKVETTERQQLELVWNMTGLPERSLEEDQLSLDRDQDEALIAPIEATFRND